MGGLDDTPDYSNFLASWSAVLRGCDGRDFILSRPRAIKQAGMVPGVFDARDYE